MIECPFESEVLEAVAAARLKPGATTEAGRQAAVVGPGYSPATQELADHLDICPSCHEAAVVAAALRDDQDAAWDDAALPSAQVVWLRAQLHARSEATRMASRPIAVVQALGVACLIGAIAALVGTTFWWLRSWVVWLGDAAAVVATAPGTFEMATLASRGILLAVGVWLVLAPVAVYLAAIED
jgi:hypothetical protein